MTDNLDFRTERQVEIKNTLDGEWVYVPYLYPLTSYMTAAPGIGTAQLRYDYGQIKQTDETAYATFYSNSIVSYYVRITIQYPTTGTFFYWVGIITEQETVNDVPDEDSGYQIFTARELSHLFDRQQLTKGYIYETSATKVLDRLPAFNKRAKVGRYNVGNRTSEPPFADSPIYSFEAREDDADVWTAMNVVQYLCRFYAPTNMFIHLVGQYSQLDEIEDVWDLEGLTLWDALNKVINRRYGLGFNVLSPTGSSVVYLNIWTTTKDTITVGVGTVEANPNTTTLTLPSAHPYWHIIGEVPQRISSSNMYDVIEARGNYIKCMGTFTKAVDDLVDGWHADQETAYKEASGSTTDAEANDRARGADKYEGVFTRYVVPFDWDGKCGHVADPEDREPLFIEVDPDSGDIDTSVVGDFYLGDKRFERDTFLQQGWDYSVSSPVNDNNSSVEPDYVPIIVGFTDSEDGSIHEATDEVIFCDRISEMVPGVYTNVSVSSVDNQMGVNLACSPRHLFAVEEWTGAKLSVHEPEFTNANLFCTAVVKHDQRIKCVETIFDVGSSETERRLVIDVDDAELWFVAPNTLIDRDDDGSFIYYTGPDFLRDDRGLLEQVAASAKAWYGVPRQVVEIDIKRVDYFYVEVGYFLTNITGMTFESPVNTVITGIKTDYRDPGTVTIETGWGNLDYAPDFVR